MENDADLENLISSETQNNETKEMEIFDIPTEEPSIEITETLIVEEKKSELLEPVSYTNSYLGATFNLINSTVGSGILGVPFVFREVGLGAIISFISLEYLRYSHKLMLQKNLKAKDYEDIGYHTYGTIMAFIVKICIVFINFGATISYTIIIGQLSKRIFVQLLGERSLLSNIFYATLLFIVPVFFLCLIKKMSQLRFISYISLTAVFSFVIYLIIGFVLNGLGDKSTDGQIYFYKFNISMLRVLGIITFSFAAHTNLCAIHCEFEIKNSDKIRYAIASNVFIDFFVYSLCGVFGYLAFLQNTRGNLLESLDFSHWYNILFTAVFCLTIFLTFPMTVFPCRLSFDNIIISLASPFEKYLKKFTNPKSTIWENIRGFLETFIIIFSGYFLAIYFPQVDVVFSLTGSTASACTSYIFPALFYIKLTKNGWFHWSCIVAYLLLLIGVVFGLSITIIQILTLTNVISLPQG
eukprot:gene10342-2756_t